MNYTKIKQCRSSRVASMMLASVVGAIPLSAAADDMFLKLDGVRGESIDARHKDEIEILSYEQSVAGPFARSAPGTPGAGKTICGPVTIVKYVDLASPELILNAANGRHIPRAEFAFRKSGQQGSEYYKVILDDVIINEVAQSDSKTAPRLTEKVSMMGRVIRFEYKATNPVGGRGAAPKFGWDCAANARA